MSRDLLDGGVLEALLGEQLKGGVLDRKARLVLLERAQPRHPSIFLDRVLTEGEHRDYVTSITYESGVSNESERSATENRLCD